MPFLNLDNQSLHVLREIVAWWIARRRGGKTNGRRVTVSALPAYIGKASSAIPALSGTTPGSGSVTIYKINDAGTLEDAGFSETAYNLASVQVESDTWLQMKREIHSGKLLIDFEDCG